jgi:ankyrin repeat protein
MSHIDQCCDMEDRVEVAPIPLLIVADMDLVPLARIFLEHGAEVEYFESDGRGKFSPLHVAHSAEMVHLLLDHNAHHDQEDEKQQHLPLYWYVLRDDVDAMRAILERGAEVNPPPRCGQPLHEAATDSLAATKLLVKHGAHVDAKDFNGDTPLHWAAQLDLTDIMRFLLEQWPEGAKERNRHQETPLHYAASQAQIETVQLLVEVWPEGKDALNDQGQTPLEMFKSEALSTPEYLSRPEYHEEIKKLSALLGSR